MSDGQISAVTDDGRPVCELDYWKDETGTVFLSRKDIARLAEGGTNCLIISLSGEDRQAANAEAAGAKRR